MEPSTTPVDPTLDPWFLPAWVLMDAESTINYFLD